MRVADYIADFVYRLGVRDIFTLTGGGSMFLVDGVAKHPGLLAVCNHHEQACAMAAVAYGKTSGNFGVALSTTGCGSTNTITGLLDAWQDNVKCLFLSGQVKRKETIRLSRMPLRQFGVQEVDIIPVVQSLTKYAVTIDEPHDIAYHLEKAVHLAAEGRPGPVWLDVPMDVQGAEIDEKNLRHFSEEKSFRKVAPVLSPDDVAQLKAIFEKSERPIVIAGNGIRLSGAVDQFKTFIQQNEIPFVTSFLGIDLMPSDHPLNIGRIGIKGTRAGNFAVQNADLVLALGTRLCVPMTGFEYEHFAREAKIVVVDIDANEHKKNTVAIDLLIEADVKNFLTGFDHHHRGRESAWADKCRHWKNKWPVCLETYSDDAAGINMYYFIDKLSANLKADAVVVSDAGSSYYVTSQALQLRSGQRYITSGAQADMGFSIPAAIGASVAKGYGEVVAITGDGSFQLNIQELQTIAHNKLPVKIFVWNNNGYLSIRATQEKFFEKRFLGTDKKCGVSFPNLMKIAEAYGIDYCSVCKAKELEMIIAKVLDATSPVICEVFCPANQEVIPTVSSMKREDGTMVSKPLEDMYPFLDRKEFESEMIVRPLAE